MKLTTRMANGRLKVNKTAVIDRLRKHFKKTRAVRELGVIQVSRGEIEQEHREMTRFNAEQFLNTAEI